SPGDSGCYPEEKPGHRVVITRAFEIGKYLVTQQEYSVIAGKNPSYFRGDNLPVDSVSWEDARKFCEAFNGMQDGHRYRLPTEAEWEYAARGRNNSAQYGVLDEVAWSRTNSDGRTHPVGAKRPNGFGMYDTLGNLWEWVQDWYGLDYYRTSPES